MDENVYRVGIYRYSHRHNALIHFSLHNKLTWIVMLHKLKLITVLSLSISASVYAGILTLSSHNITQGEFMAKIQEFKGFGCSGGEFNDYSCHLYVLHCS